MSKQRKVSFADTDQIPKTAAGIVTYFDSRKLEEENFYDENSNTKR